jgi:hypothetical protein
MQLVAGELHLTVNLNMLWIKRLLHCVDGCALLQVLDVEVQ